MKTNNALQVIFSFFLGLVVVAFVGIGVNTFYPEPPYVQDGVEQAYSDWRLTTGIILLVCATLLLAISLLLASNLGVISNGLLLGGVFTMVYAVGITISTDRSVLRFVVVAAALAVTIGIGYLRFVRGRRAAVAEPAPAAGGAGAAEGAGSTVAAGESPSGQPEFSARLDAVERKLDALARALQG